MTAVSDLFGSCMDFSLQADLNAHKDIKRKLEDRLMRACPPCELRSQLRTQQQRVLVLLEEVETARAAACATQEVVQKYEREVHMLQRALSIHAAEFQRNGEESVHSSLILALAEVCSWADCYDSCNPFALFGSQVCIMLTMPGVATRRHDSFVAVMQAREEAVQRATELICFKKQSARSTGELEQLHEEVEQLRSQKDSISRSLLQMQATVADCQTTIHGLQEERDSALSSLETQAGQMQVCMHGSWPSLPFACCTGQACVSLTASQLVQELERLHHDTRAHASSLLKHCAELKSAAEVAQAARQDEAQSLADQWEARIRQQDCEHQAATDSLRQQLADLAKQLKNASSQSAETREAMEALQQSRDARMHQLEQKLSETQQSLEDCRTAKQRASQLAEAQEQEIHMLHEQVRDQGHHAVHCQSSSMTREN